MNKLLMLANIFSSVFNPQGVFKSSEKVEVVPSPEQQRINHIRCMERWGMKQWTIGGYIVWARDEKNAVRKVNNILNR